MHCNISPREREVLHLIAYENTSQEIASKLYISNHTANSHRKNLMGKLHVKNTAGLVRRGFELGILEVNRGIKICSMAIVLLFYGSLLSGQTYNTPEFNFGNIFSLSASGLPNPICGDISGVVTSSVLDALDFDEAEYLLAKRGEEFSFVVSIGHFNQINGIIEVFYITDAGTPDQANLRLLGENLFSLGGQVEQGFDVSHTPTKGSLGDIIHIRVFPTGGGLLNIYIPVAVEGIIDEEVPIIGSFLTPMIPYLILHDPPGDGSFSSFARSDEVCRSQSTTYATSNSAGFSLTAQVGFQGSLGIIPGFLGASVKHTVAVTGGLKVTSDLSNGQEVRTCVEFTSEFKTGNTDGEIGPSADRYIGTGNRWNYGVYDLVVVKDCDLSIQEELVYAADSTGATEFNFTEAGIRDDIEKQENIVNNLDNSLLERERAFNQIEVWQQILDRNKNNRDNANYTESFALDPSAPETRSVTSSTSTVSNLSYNVALDRSISSEITLLTAGNGIYGGPQFSFNSERGGSITNEAGTTQDISYTIQDDQDRIDYDVDVDPEYGTPLFRLTPGIASTSCPYEGGARKDLPRVFVEQDGLDPGVKFQCPVLTRDRVSTETETVVVSICNDHPSLSRSFDIMASGNNNSLGLLINGTDLSSSPFGNIGSIAPNSCEEFTLFMTKQPQEDVYNDILLRVYPSCLSSTPSLIQEESDSLLIQITFNGPGNYPSDLDCDGVSDAIDPCPMQTSEGDDDCDGLTNDIDDCPLDETNSDIDLDGVLDCIDLCSGLQESTLNFDRDNTIATDSEADYVSVPHNAQLNLSGEDFTIEAWVMPTDDFFKTIISKGDGTLAGTNFAWVIWNRDMADPVSGRLGLLINGEWQYSDNQIPLNRWTHVAVTFEGDGNQATFYIDGQFSGVRRFNSAVPMPNTSSMSIGVWGNDTSAKRWGFKGSLDELSIWNRSLEIEEIRIRRSHGLASITPNLIAYYKFDDNVPCVPGGSTLLEDVGPNNAGGSVSPFDGTLQSFDLGRNLNGDNSPCESNWSEARNPDLNQDGIGDVCSTSPCLSSDADNDGLSDCIDLCPNTANTALHFDGTNWAETVSSPSVVGFDNPRNFAFSAWIYPTSDEQLTIVSQGHGSNALTSFILSKVNGDGTLFPEKDHNKIGLFLANLATGEWQVSDTAVPLNEWTHVAVSVNNRTASFYINGVFDGFKGYAFANFSDTGGPMYIGRQGQVCNCNYFRGRLDDLTVWSNTLDNYEVNALYSSGVVGDETDLIAAYNFNDGIPCQGPASANVISDISTGGTFAANMFNFDLTENNCNRNWIQGRNVDSDENGIGDACESSTFACASSIRTADAGPDGDFIPDCTDLCPSSPQTALRFSGTFFDNFVTVPHHQDFNMANNDFSLELWVNPVFPDQDITMITKGHGQNSSTIYSLAIMGNGVRQFENKVGLNISGEWVYSNSRIRAETWTHIGVTFDFLDRTVTFYINGVRDSQPRILSESNILFNADTNPLFIGRDPSNTAASRFSATIEDVIIWDRKLSSTEIQRSMEASLVGTEQGLVAYYKFDDGVPRGTNAGNTILQDSSPNGRDGTLINFQFSGLVSNWVSGRNLDTDGDGVGDGCDDGLPCPPDYAGDNALDDIIRFSNNFDTNGKIESSQSIRNDINVIYNSGNEVDLLQGFEVQRSAIMEVQNVGCQ